MVATTFPRWAGDARPRFVYDLARYLVRAGVEVVVLAPHHEGAKFSEEMDGVKVVRHPYFFPFKYQDLCWGGGIRERLRHSLLARIQLPLLAGSQRLFMFWLMLREKPDLIHAHWILPQGLNAWVVGLLFGKRYVVSVHAGDVFPLKSRVLKRVSSFVLSHAASVTVNSRATDDEVRVLCGHVGSELIPMGVDVEKFKPGSGRRDKTVLYVGRLAEKKGVEYLVKAFPAVKEAHPDAKLVIVGEGDELENLKNLAESIGFKKSMSFEGSVNHDRLRDYYQRGSVLVLPAVYDSEGDTEGLGVVLLEALASAMPVVASNIGGITDIVEHEVNGLLVEPGDVKGLGEAVNRLLDDEGLRERLASRGREMVVERFGWENIAKEFKRAYGEVLG
ncbi:MAG: glycosyltransferase [Candidatus Altiarchaeales archaeon]|nr:glycosyltransferase [Candidatus Altiarchaeales archaeon]MBD3417286.1 glycosyltransferase [Candidatus Altiarchaeales archaeon]